MADGSLFPDFAPARPAFGADELIVDLFAGGGGASVGIEMALGRSPDIAVNHDADAIRMHAVNHPATLHFQRNVWQVDPIEAVRNRRVGLLWASPDCKHHSKAKGGKPLKRNIRDLAWVVVRWAKQVRPRVILLENVEEFRDWGPLTADQRPCPERKGQTFNQWTADLRRLGYKVEWREMRGCDYGAPTIRKRLFLIARRDGQKIAWPKPTHGAPGSEGVLSGRLKPWRTAAEIIDWSRPCPSIFLTREEGRAIGCNRPLADNTMARIARGVQRYVVEAAKPFIVPVSGASVAPVISYAQQGGGNRDITQPMHTICASVKDHNTLIAPYMVPRYGERDGQEPRTYPADKPLPTVVPTGNGGSLTAAHLLSLKGSERRARDAEAPSPSVTAQGWHIAEVRAFLIKYYGAGVGQELQEPTHTVTVQDRFGLVTVAGEPYQIVDIGMRMLTPRELFAAQGFPPSYIIAQDAEGRPFTATVQVKCCGNSVCPPLAQALVSANVPDLARMREAAK